MNLRSLEPQRQLIFSKNAKKLITIMCKQDARIKIFSHTLVNIFGKHFQNISKISKITQFINQSQVIQIKKFFKIYVN